MTALEDQTAPYYRVFLTISVHPRHPFDGNRISFSGEIPDDFLDMEQVKPVHDAALDRFDIDEWRTGLYVGQLFLTEDGTPIGVEWEDVPQVYEHGMGTNPVDGLPDSLTPLDEVLA